MGCPAAILAPVTAFLLQCLGRCWREAFPRGVQANAVPDPGFFCGLRRISTRRNRQVRGCSAMVGAVVRVFCPIARYRARAHGSWMRSQRGRMRACHAECRDDRGGV